MTMKMQVIGKAGTKKVEMNVDHLVIAGWAARDTDAMEHHIRELEALGVARPKETPTFYRISAARLTTAPVIEAIGETSSGEAEPVIFAQDGQLYAGVGSDHTDRQAETHGVALSKQMCDKPVAATVWPFREVSGHWDSLMLRSWRVTGGKRELYQEGAVASLLAPGDLIERYSGGKGLRDGSAIFGGTMPAIGGIRPAERFECELEDPVLSRRIAFGYDIATLPVAG